MHKIRILTELSPAQRKPHDLNSLFRLTHVLCQEWSCRYFLRYETKTWSHFTLSCCYIAGIPTTLFLIWGKPSCFLYETVSCLLKPLNGIQRNLTWSKILTSSSKVCFFRADRKNKMAALASDWLRHFRFLLWNRWTEFNGTWQGARSQRPLPSLCFSGRFEKQDGRPGLWLAETFSTTPLKQLNRIQRNLTGSKISTSSTRFVFFGPIRKTRWPSWPLIGWDIFDYSSETAGRNSTKLDRKQDLNVLYQVCVFRAKAKKKMCVYGPPTVPNFWPQP